MLHIGVFIEGHQKDFFVSKHEARSVRIHLTKRAMSIAQDIFISIRILDACCYLTPPQNFCWEDESCDERIVEEGYYKIYQGLFEISIVVSHWTQQQMIFEKYAFVVGNSISIGREKENVLWVQHSLVTKHHGKLIKSQGNIAIYQDHSSNGTFINGVRCHNEQVPLQYGDCIYIAPDLRIIYLDSCIAVNGAKALKCCRLPVANIVATLSTTEASNSSKIYFHRSPRLIEPADNQEIDIEPPITKADNPSQPLWLTLGPSTTMVLPMLAGSLVMAQNGSGFMASGLVMVGTSAMLATMWGVVNSNHRKKQALITEKKRITLYRQYLGEVESLLKQRSAAELGRLCKNDLTAAQCITFPIHLDNRLWERMPGHMDFLSVRLGNGDVTLTPIAIPKKHLSMIEDPLCDEPARLQQQYKALYNAPYTISLRQRTFIGIIGEEAAQSLVYSIIVQATAMHSYNDLRLCVLCDESEADQWQWARWLAHNFTSENRDFRLVASCQRSITEALNHLYEVLNTRIEQAKEHQRESDAPLGDVKNQPLPHYVVICTKPELLEGQQLIHHLLRGYLGVTLLLLAPSMDYLPKECKLIINTETTNPGVFTPNGQVDRISFESISLDNAAQFAKAMAPIYVRDTTENTAIPNYVSFLDSYQIGSTEQLDVWRFWSENMTCDGLRAVIGLKSGAMPFVLDISERVHGPHGLIAGTTGSGKSVLLQTYILSLAINYAPSQIQFALIDYKGGGMANAFSSLPHVAGIISDIQGAQDIARALASVQGEIERRKHLLAVGHVENVDEYNRLYRNTNTKLISHLLIVVDEFAELRKENPEFMKELISAARVGRSLGIHLILATQKPANSVDDEIWSNTRFRLCLRVASRGDSMETLKRPDAAYLKEMGRCYVQVGSDELFEEVQTCFSGAPYHPHEIGPEQMPRLLNEVGKPITLKKQRSRSSNKEYTQMNAVLDRIKAVALEHHVSDAPQLWKKRLHSVLFLDQIDLYRQGKRGTYNKQDAKMDEIKVCVGYADDVAHQQYCPFAVDLTAKRNYLFVGMPQSGKTTTLQTIAIALAETYTPQQVQMYAFSLSSKVLGTLRHLPHVGGIVFDDEPEEEIRLLVMLEKESQRRKDWFAKASTDSFLAYSQVSQGDTVLPTLPAVVVFVDRLFQAKELMGDDAFARLTNLLKEGSSCGLFFIATALSRSEVNWKIQSCLHPIALENSTRSEYCDILGQRVPN